MGFDREDRIREKLVREGQHPKAVVLTCSDSRACPETLFEVEPGHLFVIRVAGNVLNSEILASLEYAVLELGIPLILVLGHTECGAIKMALSHQTKQSPAASPFLEKLLSGIISQIQNAEGSKNEEEALRSHTEGVVSAIAKESSLLRTAIENKRLDVVGGIHDLRTGKVQIL